MKLPQERVAARARIHPKYLGEIERGEKNPTAHVIMNLSSALHVPVCKILHEEHCPYNNNGFLAAVNNLFGDKNDKDRKRALEILKLVFDCQDMSAADLS